MKFNDPDKKIWELFLKISSFPSTKVIPNDWQIKKKWFKLRIPDNVYSCWLVKSAIILSQILNNDLNNVYTFLVFCFIFFNYLLKDIFSRQVCASDKCDVWNLQTTVSQFTWSKEEKFFFCLVSFPFSFLLLFLFFSIFILSSEDVDEVSTRFWTGKHSSSMFDTRRG